MDENKEVEVSENATTTYVDVEAVEVIAENEATDVGAEQVVTDIDVSDENTIEIEISEAFPSATDGIIDLENTDVLIDGGTVDSVNSQTISIQEVLENCAALGGADNISHGALYGTEQPNQHPISAITDLEEELADIKALKTIYSNKSGLADYYLWQDGNESKEDRFGHFVSKCSDNTIKIIENKDEDVFGVVTDTSAFIGGQNDTARDYRYGLIVYTGETRVRCESDVVIGDYVTTNNFGRAKKSEGGYGYKVNAVETVHDNQIYYATISLNISANQMNDLGTDVGDLDVRMDSAEKNITSAINVANKAYNLASGLGDIGSLNASTVEKAEEALDKAESALNTAEGLNSQIQSAVTTATQAKTIANTAVTSAESIKTEAVGVANQALSEATKTRTELQGQINQTKTDLDNTRSELISSISGVEGTVADFKTEVEDTYATQEMLTAYKDESSTALADYKQEVEKNYATQEMVSLVEEGAANALSLYRQEVTNTYATQELVSQYKDDASDALTTYKQEVKDNYATQEMLTALETETSKALTDYKQEVTDTYAKAETLTSFQGDVNDALTTLTQKSDENGAYIQGFVANIDKYSYGKYSQANRFTYEEVLNILELGVVYVPSVDHTEVYEASDAYEAVTYHFQKGYYYTWSADEQGKVTWVGTVTPSVAFSSEYAIGNHNMSYWVAEADLTYDDVNYEKDCLYKLVDNIWIKVATLKGNLGSVTTSIFKQTSNSIESAVADINENYAGTKTWVDDNKAAIQDVVSWHGENGDSLVTFMQEAGDNFASASQVAQIVDKDGNINAASVVTAVNESGSSVTIDADHINFTGFTTFVRPDDLSISNATTINGDNITTGTISSNGYTDTNSNVYSTTGTCFNLDDGSITAPNFAVTSDGYLYAANARVHGRITATDGSFTGTVTATSGSFTDCDIKNGCTIAGFTIDDSIYHTKTSYDGTASDGVYIGTDGIGLGKGTFYVNNTGYLYATDAHVEGGKIGGWVIDDNYIISEDGLVGLYSGNDDNMSGPTTNCASLVDDSIRTVRFFAGNASKDDMNLARFRVLSDGSLYTSAAQITGGVLSINVNDENYVKIGENSNGMSIYQSTDMQSIWGTETSCYPYTIYRANSIYFYYTSQRGDIDTSENQHMTGMIMHRANDMALVGKWNIDAGSTLTIEQYGNLVLEEGANLISPTSLATSSDASLKHNIESLDARYDILFDNLISRRFIYNNGTSSRYHTGYVTQETKNALQKAKISEQEFAAICTLNKGSDKEYDALRYDEFVSLNTWQIQKAKGRIAALEDKVAALEERIVQLENK